MFVTSVVSAFSSIVSVICVISEPVSFKFLWIDASVSSRHNWVPIYMCCLFISLLHRLKGIP